MSIVKMKRLRAIGLSSERDELLSRMLSIGCIEVIEPEAELANPQWMELLHKEASPLSEAKSKATAVNNAMEALRKYAQLKSGMFTLRKGIRESEFLSENAMEEALSTADQINQYVQQINQANTQENRLNAQRANLTPWQPLDLPLESASTEHACVCFGVCPSGVELEPLKAELAQGAPTAELIVSSTDKDQHYLLLLCHRSEEEQALAVLKPHSFNTLSFKDVTGTAAGNIARIDAELKEVQKNRQDCEQALAGMGSSQQDLQICFDRLTGEVDKAAAAEKLLTNGTIVFLEGWITEPGLEKMEKAFGGLTCAWETEEPQEEDEPPVLLENRTWMNPINMVTEMYSMPAYRGIDPNPLIFWFFIFFFGFMFADVAYGIIIWAVCHIITTKYHPKNTMGYMFRLGRYLGVSTAICGIFTGGFFGDVIPKFAEQMLGMSADQLPGWLQTFNNGIVVSPIGNPMLVLVIAIIIGVIHLVFGQCIHIYLGFRDGTPVDNLLDVVPWWLFFGSIGLVAAGLPWWCIVIGALILVATQGHTKKGIIGKVMGGVASLYDVTSWLSDILSYSRLMALMLATSVIASVMNTLGTLGGLSAVGVVLFVVVFLVGHVFNIGVNVIGTYVHAARLQYLEFFGKFYIEGGAPFQPLTYKTKYVDIIEEEK